MLWKLIQKSIFCKLPNLQILFLVEIWRYFQSLNDLYLKHVIETETLEQIGDA